MAEGATKFVVVMRLAGKEPPEISQKILCYIYIGTLIAVLNGA